MRAEESTRRVAAVRRRLTDLGLDALVVTAPENVRYLSGFTGTLGYLVISGDGAEILGDSRYWLQMVAEAPAITLVRSVASSGLFALLADRLKGLSPRRVGFESQHLTVDQHRRLVESLPADVALVPTAGLVEELRMLKTPDEVELLRQVAGIASQAFDRVRSVIRPGLRERDVAFLLEQTFRELGADGPAGAVDRRARDVLAAEAHAFGHGLGHGIGLMVHERPFLSPTDQTPLQAGMVITNEPGIYRPGWGGVRLEEMVLVTEAGPQVLTPASHEVGVG